MVAGSSKNRLSLPDPNGAIIEFNKLSNPVLLPLRHLAGVIAVVVCITAMSAGQLAGLNGGLIYNKFRSMGTRYTPPLTNLVDPFYLHYQDYSDPRWPNMLENPTTMQFNYRYLVISTISLIPAVFAYSKLIPAVSRVFTKSGRKGIIRVTYLAILLVFPGFGTLAYMVSTHPVATHQVWSLALFTGTIVVASRVWLPRAAVKAA